MTEITFPNSLFESWWRTLKHQWLYLNMLDTVSTLHKAIEFYMDEHVDTNLMLAVSIEICGIYSS